MNGRALHASTPPPPPLPSEEWDPRLPFPNDKATVVWSEQNNIGSDFDSPLHNQGGGWKLWQTCIPHSSVLVPLLCTVAVLLWRGAASTLLSEEFEWPVSAR